MKKIAIFANGNSGLIDPDSPHKILVNGKKPIKYLEANEKNVEKYLNKKNKKDKVKV